MSSEPLGHFPLGDARHQCTTYRPLEASHHLVAIHSPSLHLESARCDPQVRASRTPLRKLRPSRFFDRGRKTFPARRVLPPRMVQDALRLHKPLPEISCNGELFSKNFARRPPVRRFWPQGGADSCRRGERPPGTGPAGVGDGGFDLRITEVSEGGSVPFCGLKTSAASPSDPGRGGTCRREAEPDRQRQHHHPPGRGDLTLQCPAWRAGRWNFNRRDFQAGEASVPGEVAGDCRKAKRRGKPGCGRKLPQRPGRGLA